MTDRDEDERPGEQPDAPSPPDEGSEGVERPAEAAAPSEPPKKKRKKKKAAAQAKPEGDDASDAPSADAAKSEDAGELEPSSTEPEPPSTEPEPPSTELDPPSAMHEAALAPARVHRIRGGVIFALGLISTFLLMAWMEPIDLGPLYTMGTVAVTVVGLLDMLGLLAAQSRSASALSSATDWRYTTLFVRDGEPLFMAPVVTVPASIAVFVLLAIAGGYAELPAAILCALAVLLPSTIRRPALLTFVVCAAVILPFLGVYGLWDPWETHYGEVAREILARHDWISLWWAQEDWFWSKPIFIFWIEALSMGALGVDYHADANPAHPEWAIRLPHFLLSMGALLAVHALVSKLRGRRAGVVAALVLCTTPYFFMLSHQAITDMPFVSTMTMAMCMLGFAVLEDDGREVGLYRFGPIVLSGQHAVLGALAAVSLPQAIYLATRNVALTSGGFLWHGDRFMFGSAGNGGNPGNPDVREVGPAFEGLLAQPMSQAILWLVGFAVLASVLRKERRARSLYMFAFYVFCALSFMAKGIPGFALPGMVALFWLIATRRWDLLLGGELRVALGVLVVAVVGLPWYVAMYIRHGQGFTDRLLVHDHINRLTSGVHGDTGSVEYFIEQLGAGLFPWIALVPLAVGAWVLAGRREERAGDEASRLARQVLVMIGLWGTSAFVLFSGMTTKFHHYIFPAVPAVSILVGVAVDRLLGPASEMKVPSIHAAGGTLAAVVAPVCAAIGLAGLYGDVRGVVPESVGAAERSDWVLDHPWYLEHCVIWIALGLGLAGLAVYLLRGAVPVDEPSTRRGTGAAAALGLLVAPAILAMVGRDLSWVTSTRPHGYERLIHLFVYNYSRPWPDYLDYRPILTGFVIVGCTLIGLAALAPLRQAAVRGFLGLALAFSAWSLDVYMIDLSPHWGQRELLQRYYELRSGPSEPVIAWQMNWKGENFYTGNRVYAFVDLDNRRLMDWVRSHPGQRCFFLLEHSRVASLRSTLRDAVIEPRTDERLDNKFLLVEVTLPGAPVAPAPAAP